jgi:hypothetical protein
VIQPRYATKLSLGEFFIVLGTGIVLSVPTLFLDFWVAYKYETAWWMIPMVVVLSCIAFVGLYIVKVCLAALRDGMVNSV